jgi:hypothetical protein
MEHTYPIPRAERLRIAVAADVDVRSVEAELRGEPVAGRSGRRVREALRAESLPTSDKATGAA